jgi:hypothetical protein
MTTSIKAAKAMARHLAEALSQAGQELPHSNLLEIVAKGLGARNWHAFQASATQSSTVPVTAAPATAVLPWNRLYGAQTPAQFLSEGGGCCPVCGCTDMSGGSFDVEGDTCSQEVSCLDCHATWSETYTRSSYSLSDEATVQADHLFIESVYAWLKAGCGDESQYELDDIIVNWFSNRQLPQMNVTSCEAEQERLLSTAELTASEINNQGIRGQLDFLWDELRTRKALVEFLSTQMGLDSSELIFLTKSQD